MKLHEIDRMIEECVDKETGEVIDVLKLKELHMAREEKIRNVALWIKNIKSDIVALKAEKESFAERQRVEENKLERLKQFLMYATDGQNIKRPEFTVSFRKVAGTNVLNEEAVPDAYKIPQAPKLDKQTILKELKEGAEIPGVELKETLSMTIR